MMAVVLANGSPSAHFARVLALEREVVVHSAVGLPSGVAQESRFRAVFKSPHLVLGPAAVAEHGVALPELLSVVALVSDTCESWQIESLP